jgi:8-oxo-dGTP pyrophosphatase MutT (NUDIX family)
MTEQKGWKTISSKIGFQGEYLKVRVDKVERPSGTTGIYEFVDKPGFIMVIPKVGDKFYLAEQYRYALDSRSWEFPQGGCEGISDLATCARKELEEELGLNTGDLRLLGNLWLAVGNSNQGCGIYLADQLTEGRQQLEEGEAGSNLISKLFTEEQIKKMIKSGKIRCSMTIAAFNLYLLNK